MENCWVLKCMHLKFRTRVVASLYFFNSWNVYLSILSPELYFQTSWLNLHVKRKNTSHRQAICEKKWVKKVPKEDMQLTKQMQMSHLISLWGSGHWSHSEILLYYQILIGVIMEHQELSDTVNENANWYKLFGKQFGII